MFPACRSVRPSIGLSSAILFSIAVGLTPAFGAPGAGPVSARDARAPFALSGQPAAAEHSGGAATPQNGKETGGAIAGTVSDPDGGAVGDAVVLVTRAAGVSATLRTDEQGRFRADGLPPGRYDLLVALDGFRADPVAVTVVGRETREVDVHLHISAVSESVVVSASQVDVPLSRVADSASVISARDISARQIDNVADALRLVPGLEVARNGGRGSVTSLFARGGESDYSLVLVNGVRANAFGGNFDFSQLPSANIERIEVVRGPGSALFGSDAIGSVIQIVTRDGGRPQAAASIEGGSLGTTRLTAASSGSRGRWSWGGAVERVASDGFTGIAPATGERVSNDDYRAHQATGTARWRSDGGPEIALNAGWVSSDRGYPGAFGSNPIGAYAGVDRLSRGAVDTRQGGVSLVAPLAGGRIRQHAQASYFDLASDFRSSYGLSSSGTRRFTARAQTDVTVSANTRLSAGVDLQYERARNDFITGTTSSPVPIVRNLVGAFAEVRHEHGSRLTVSGGMRVESVMRRALDGSPNPFTPRPPFPADTARAINPKGSASYLLYQGSAGATRGRLVPAWVRVRGSAGTGMRAPDAIEIAFTDNPHLRPERSRAGEVGVESGLAGGRAVVEATFFSNRYEDLIVAVGPAIRDASRFQTDNIANARSQGLEIGGHVRTGWGLDAHVAYTLLDTAVLAVDRTGGQAPPPFHVGDLLLRRPRHQGSIDLVFARGRMTLFSEVGARGRTLDVEPNYGAFGGLFWNPGFATARAGASWRVWRGVEIVGRVENVFDRRYEETFGFPALGRTVMAGVRVAAGR